MLFNAGDAQVSVFTQISKKSDLRRVGFMCEHTSRYGPFPTESVNSTQRSGRIQRSRTRQMISIQRAETIFGGTERSVLLEIKHISLDGSNKHGSNERMQTKEEAMSSAGHHR